MLKHQPCCRAVLAEKQNKKIIHKNPVLVPFPLKSQGQGSRLLPSPPALQDGWATRGGPMGVMVWCGGCWLSSWCCRPIPSRHWQDRGSPEPTSSARVLASLWYPGAVEGRGGCISFEAGSKERERTGDAV